MQAALFDDDSFSTVSLDDSETGLHCQPCSRDGETMDAEWFCVDCDDFLCDQCWKSHRKIKTLQKHVLLDKAEAKTRKKKGGVAVVSAPPSNDVPPEKQCPEHEGLWEDYFCTDCSVFCCSECETISHKECETVYLPDMSKYLQGPIDLDKLQREVDIVMEGARKVRDKMGNHIDEIEEKTMQVAEPMKDFMDGISELFGNLMGEFTGIIGNIHEQSEARRQNFISRCEEAEKRIRKAEEEITRGKENGDLEASVLFQQMSIVNNTLNVIAEDTKEDGTMSHKHAMESVTQIMRFVTLLRNFVQGVELKPIPDFDLANFSLESEDDEQAPSITGALVTSKRLIVADRGNQKIKVFDTVKQELVAELKLSSLFQCD